MSRRLSVRIRTRSGLDFSEELDADITIDALKLIIEPRVEIESFKQRVIYKGSLCDDDASLESLGFDDGDEVWIEGGGGASASSSATTAPAAIPATTTNATTQPNMFTIPTQPQPNPFMPFSMFGPPGSTSSSSIPPSQQQQPFGGATNLFGSSAAGTGGFPFTGFNLNPAPSATGQQQQQFNPFGQFANMMGTGGVPPNGNGQQQQPFDFSQMMQNPMVRSMMENMSNNPEMFRNLFNSSPAFQRILEENPQLRHMLDDDQLFQTAMRAAQDPDYYNEMLRSNDRALQNIESLPGGFSALSKMYNQIQRPMEDAMDDMFRQRFGQPRTVVSEVDTSQSTPTRDQMPNPWAPNGRAPPEVRPTREQRNNANSPRRPPVRSEVNEPSERPRRNGEVVSSVMNDDEQKAAVRNVLSNPESLRAVVEKMLESNPALRERVAQNPELREMLTDSRRMAQLLNPGVIDEVRSQSERRTREEYREQLAELVENGFCDETANVAALKQTNGDVEEAIMVLAQQLAEAEDD